MSDPYSHAKLRASISIVTPTLDRPDEVRDLLESSKGQTVLPLEVIVVDGAPPLRDQTQRVVEDARHWAPFACRYRRQGGGTAVQRNAGIDQATGDYIAFIDDDIRLDQDFFERIMEVFAQDVGGRVGGITGYILNQHLDPNSSPRWRWYRRFRLFATYEPGRYDFESGYPINRYLQPPHEGVREIDFMGCGCAVWRRAVFEDGLRFSEFFTGYGVLEDAHLALRARRRWSLLECGRARCQHLRQAVGREDSRQIAWKSAVNYRFVFMDIVPQRTMSQELRFWRVQLFDLLRFFLYAVRVPRAASWQTVLGKAQGIVAATKLRSTA